MLETALPVDGLIALTDFLCISAATTRCGNPPDRPAESDESSPADSLTANTTGVLALTSVAEATLVRAENQARAAESLARASKMDDSIPVDGAETKVVFHPLSQHFRDSMYTALMAVMEERDEAHARMVAADVVHVHEMEQQRKTVRRLSSEMDELRSKRDAATPSNDMTPQRHRSMQQDSEAELLSLCQQLGNEISARTSASLEIIRLKESRKVEREIEAAERKALEDELARTKAALTAATSKLERSRRESKSWQTSYEELVQNGDLDAGS